MSLRLARRIGDAAAPLDPAADALQSAARALPQPLRDLLDGVWFGAPLHPALTDVPLGSWTAAAAFDALDAPDAADAALAVGVLGALPAALTGLNDWSHLRGDSKRIGMVHALLNTTGLALNVASLVLRRRGSRDAGRVLSGLAFGGALFSAHLGGQLSFGLGVRVNRTAFESPEHEWKAVLDESELGDRELRRVEVDGDPALLARATDGRICAIAATCTHLGGQLSFGLGVRVNRTAFESPEHEWQAALDESELGDRELRRVEVDGEPALLARATDGRICAIAATCTHLGGPLDEGERDGDVVVCPWHGSRFDLCDGAVHAGPAVFPQPRYETRVSEGRIELRPAPNT